MPQKQILKECRSMLKKGKEHIARGNMLRAEFFLQRAHEAALQVQDEKVRDDKCAHVMHQLAEVAVRNNEPMLAQRRYREALKLVDVNNLVAFARVKRDYAELLRRQGDLKAGRRDVIAALELLESIDSPSERAKEELRFTEGIAARFDLTNPKKRSDAIKTLHRVAQENRGYRKPPYEREALRCLFEEVLPIYSPMRMEYIRRAVVISIKLGDFRQAGEYVSLLGGDTSRSAFNLVVR